jgi:hypothetical protein
MAVTLIAQKNASTNIFLKRNSTLNTITGKAILIGQLGTKIHYHITETQIDNDFVALNIYRAI